MKPWERHGYDFSGRINPLYDTEANQRSVQEWATDPPESPDIGAAAVVISNADGDTSSVSLGDAAPDISADDLKLMRQQHAHLR